MQDSSLIEPRKDSVTLFWQLAEPEDDRPQWRRFQGHLAAKGRGFCLSLASHAPTLNLDPGPKPQPALWFVLEIVNESLLGSDAAFPLLMFLRTEFPLVQTKSALLSSG